MRLTTWWNSARQALAQRWLAPWWRPMLPAEQVFVEHFFGAAQGAWLMARVRLGQRRVGDTQRALCMQGSWVSVPRSFFTADNFHQPLRLSHPAVAGIWAHELLHALQRQQGLPVTREALVLHCRWWLQRRDPYSYSCQRSPRALLRQFWLANVEQQGQMWQDCVQAQVAGQPLASHALLPLAVQRGRLRRRRHEVGDVQQ